MAALPPPPSTSVSQRFNRVLRAIILSTSPALPHVTCMRRGDGERAQFDPLAPTVLFLHGILGSGKNWSTFAKRVAQQCALQAVLLDLRCHGACPERPGPHSVAAAAADVVEAAAELGRAPDAVVGHSFGGKVALSYAEQSLVTPRATWVLDSMIGPFSFPATGAPSSFPSVSQQLRRVKMPCGSRGDVEQQLRSLGLSSAVQAWIMSSLKTTARGSEFAFDLDGAEQMFADYCSADLWHVVENPPAQCSVAFVRAENGGLPLQSSLQRLGKALGDKSHLLGKCGHWLHMDNPQGLFDILRPSLMEIGANK